jgi:2-hydroxychromene-2-carboxylate isomerase
MRLVELERSTGVQFRWRPFHLRVVLQEMKDVPFADKPTKSAYMWGDIEQRAAMYGIPVSPPASYPVKPMDATTIEPVQRKAELLGVPWAARFLASLPVFRRKQGGFQEKQGGD